MEELAKNLNKFLQVDDPRKVFGIKGDWGVGKTHFWKSYRSNLNLKDTSCQGIRYTSAFGVDSEEKLLALLAADGFNDKNKIKRLVGELIKIFKLPYVSSTGPIAKHIENGLIKKSLICIDDLERSPMSGNAMLGLVSRLTQELDCKVILLYNEDKVEPKIKEDLDLYREKVIDSEFKYAPSIEQNLGIVWKSSIPETVLRVFKYFENPNIRIIVRVDWIHKQLQDGLEGQTETMVNHLIDNATILSVIFYGGYGGFSLQEAINYSPYGLVWDDDETENKETDKFKVLAELKYSPHDLDFLIVALLENGYAAFEEHRSIIAECSSATERLKIEQWHSEIWDKYRNNFTFTQSNFMDEMTDIILKHHQKIRPVDVITTVLFLQKLDVQTDYNSILDNSVTRFVEASKRDNFHDERMKTYDFPEEINNKIKSELEKKFRSKTFEEVFEYVANGNSPNPIETKILENQSEDYLFSFLESCKMENLPQLIASYLQAFSRPDLKDCKAPVIMRAALKRIGERSPMDFHRVRRLIDPDL